MGNQKLTKEKAWNYGYNAGRYMVMNNASTNLKIFSSSENTKAWKQGKEDGTKDRNKN